MGNSNIQIIAETAFSHEGKFDYLTKQIYAAHQGKVDFVKFQVFLETDAYYTTNHPAKESIGCWLFTQEQWLEVFELAKSLGLKILVLPLEIKAMEFCLKYQSQIDGIELHSVCFNETPLLRKFDDFKGEIFLGIGGRLPEEINTALKILKKKKNNIILQYGFQAFPTKPEDTNLGRFIYLKHLFNCKMGYADHSWYSDPVFHQLNTISFSLGVTYFEKHLVVDKGIKRTDYESAIDFEGFIEMRQQLENIKVYFGNGDLFSLSNNERNYRNRQKVLVASKNLKKGHAIELKDIEYKISNEHTPQSLTDFSIIEGHILNENILKNDLLKQSHFYL